MSKSPAPGLYSPAFEHDSCGFGLVARLDDRPQRAIVDAALVALDLAPGGYEMVEDDPDLVRFATHAFRTDGLPAGRVAVVSGAMDGLERGLRAHLRQGDAIGIDHYPERVVNNANACRQATDWFTVTLNLRITAESNFRATQVLHVRTVRELAGYEARYVCDDFRRTDSFDDEHVQHAVSVLRLRRDAHAAAEERAVTQQDRKRALIAHASRGCAHPDAWRVKRKRAVHETDGVAPASVITPGHHVHDVSIEAGPARVQEKPGLRHAVAFQNNLADIERDRAPVRERCTRALEATRNAERSCPVVTRAERQDANGQCVRRATACREQAVHRFVRGPVATGDGKPPPAARETERGKAPGVARGLRFVNVAVDPRGAQVLAETFPAPAAPRGTAHRVEDDKPACVFRLRILRDDDSSVHAQHAGRTPVVPFRSYATRWPSGVSSADTPDDRVAAVPVRPFILDLDQGIRAPTVRA